MEEQEKDDTPIDIDSKMEIQEPTLPPPIEENPDPPSPNNEARNSDVISGENESLFTSILSDDELHESELEETEEKAETHEEQEPAEEEIVGDEEEDHSSHTEDAEDSDLESEEEQEKSVDNDEDGVGEQLKINANDNSQVQTEETKNEGDFNKSSSMLSDNLKVVSTNKEIPKMRSRFVMSNQQIRDLIDPNNQRAFNEKIFKLNELLESTQKEYCNEVTKHRQCTGQEEKKFELSKGLLEALVYEDELDLPGNFLQQTVGRRLNDNDMPVIAEFLMADTAVARINFAYNDFADEGLLVLAGVLMSRGDINHVNLAHNNITPTGCFHFTQFLMQRESLHSLKLTGMKIGEEGFNGLICLTMCGRCPYDLDVGETDLRMSSFQGLCSSWEAMDKDLDAPKYLLNHPMPIPLSDLAEMKITNNERKRREKNLQYRRSLVELVANDGDGSNKIKSEFSMQLQPETEKMPEDPIPGGQDPVHNLEKLSASVLEGLFEMPGLNPIGENQQPTLSSTMLEEAQVEAEQYKLDSQEIPDTSLIVEEFNKIKESGCLPFDSDGKPVIICPSLYSLDIDDVLQGPPDTRANSGNKKEHFIPSTLDEVMEKAAIFTANNRASRVPDDETAAIAANKTVNRAFQEAGQLASTSDYQEKSDTAQILLQIALDTCEKLREWQDSQSEFKEADLEVIWNVATQNALQVIERRIPVAQCSLNHNDALAFVRKFMESTNRTLLKLLQNPFIPPLLMDVGTKACREAANNKSAPGIFAPTSNTTLKNDNNYVQTIVLNFLEGAITEAATLIGSGDPFSFRKRDDDSLEERLERSKNMCNDIETHIGSVLDDFFFAGTLLAEDAINTMKDLEVAEEKAVEPSNAFVDELFDQVAQLIIDTEENAKTAGVDTEFLALKFPFATRPTRLVLNRPLFQDFEPIMASKMGDFLRTNTSLKCLHLRKWNLGEDGMQSLMDGLVFNTNIVVLDLGSNGIGPQGIKVLAQFVMNNPNLKHLILNHNGLRNPGLKYLTAAIKTSNLIFLNIAYNDISDESLDPFLEMLPQTKLRSLYAIGNYFSQSTWIMVKELFETEWLIPELCDITIQEVDGKGLIVRNAQIRDTNEWYDVPPVVANGLRRAPYFEEAAHLHVAMLEN